MNREILFRRMYRHRKTGQIRFVEWGIIDAQDRSPALMLFWEAILDDQYTGLADKNGKKIFVGDILRFDNGDTVYLEFEDWLEVSVISVGDPELDDQWRDLYRIERAEIIGNIHDNPELI